MKMKKLLAIVLLLSIGFPLIYGKQINVEQAQKIAENLRMNDPKLRSSNMDVGAMTLAYTATDKSQLRIAGSTPKSLYYVFNTPNDKGFVIIAADDVCTPIIGYTESGRYDPDSQAPAFKQWIKSVEMGIADAIGKNIQPTQRTSKEWEILSSEKNTSLRNSTIAQTIGPFIQSKWGQEAPYYNQTPLVDNQRTLTGCVATAMAQVMHYHKYPQSGYGFTESYTTRTLKRVIPSVDLNKTKYDWNNMPNEYTANTSEIQKKAVAELMWHCGASAKMDYGLYLSGAYYLDARNALVAHFGYDSSVKFSLRSGHSDIGWLELLKTEIKANRPVLYQGFYSLWDGHAFVCDGYKSDNNEATQLFHFNFGWEGSSDGWFNLFTPLDFTYLQGAITGIQPETFRDYVLAFGAYLGTTNSKNESTWAAKPGDKMSTIIYIKNEGAGAFKGNYALVLTDFNNNIKYILSDKETIIGRGKDTSPFNYVEYTVPVNTVPGKYRLRVVYRASGVSVWTILDKTSSTVAGTYEEFLVENPNVIYKLKFDKQLEVTNTNMSNVTSIQPGSTANFIFNVRNTGTVAFNGYYHVVMRMAVYPFSIYYLGKSATAQIVNPNETKAFSIQYQISSDATPGSYKVYLHQKPIVDGSYYSIWGASIERGLYERENDLMISNLRSIAAFEDDKILVYPNPVNDILNIRASSSIQQVKVVDIAGKILIQEKSYVSLISLNLSALSSGVYFVIIETQEGVRSERIIKR